MRCRACFEGGDRIIDLEENMNDLDMISDVLDKFNIKDGIKSIDMINSGHINNSYRVVTNCGTSYMVQKVNRYVFKDPTRMMSNIDRVTNYLRKKISEDGGDPDRETLRFLYSESGSNYYIMPDDSFWRVSVYLDRATAYNTVVDGKMLYNAGRSFGTFQRRLADFPMDTLYETIPDFHNTPKRLRDLFDAAHADPLGRAAEVSREVEFFRSVADKVCGIDRLQHQGLLPLRVTHNDTKYNNILIDDDTHEAICVIDLDTVMPGISCHDFGDAIRFIVNTAAEDEPDLDRVHVDMDYFTCFTQGFIGGSDGFFTDTEIDCMALGAVCMTVEVASRFLADYILGDKYFKISRPRHNLDRARNQIRLAEEMQTLYPQMQEIVYQTSGRRAV